MIDFKPNELVARYGEEGYEEWIVIRVENDIMIVRDPEEGADSFEFSFFVTDFFKV